MIRLRVLSAGSLGLGLVVALVLLLVIVTGDVRAQEGDGGGPQGIERAGQGMMPVPDRLAPPPMPENPAQADLGAHDYYLTCMACHGDRGQGLTDEWRSAWSEGDQNCWQSKCHAANHPPEGFQLPYNVPPVIGQGILERYQTAGNLHIYISSRMPWHMPGSLEEEQYWQLTAFLASANNLVPHDVVLTPDNAGSIRLAAPAPLAAAPQAAENPDERMLSASQVTLLRKGVSAGLLVGGSLVLVAALAAGILAAARRP